MENLEELKREANRFKTGGSLATKLSEYKIISALRIRSLVAKRLCIEENLPSTALSLRFLVNIVGKKKDFSIEGIRLDLINGSSIEEVAMKYCEPIEVILEIKERDLRSEEEVVASKIYTTSELAKVFSKPNTLPILNNSFLSKIREKSSSETVGWWTGEKILDNHTKILNLFNNEGITIEGKKYIPFVSIPSILGASEKITRNRIQKGCKLFGVKISTIRLQKQSGNGNNRVYALLLDVLEAKRNKKYYVKHEDVFKYNAITPGMHSALKKLYKNRFSREISFLSCYIKKETLSNFLNLTKELGCYKDEMIIKR